MMKKGCVIFFTLLLAVVGASVLLVDEVKAVPGPPMVIYGTIKDYAGASIVDGIPVCAYVVDPGPAGSEWFNYTSASGGYGFPYTGVTFNINNTEQGRTGKNVYLHVGQLNVTSFTFSAGTTKKNLTIADDPTVLSNASDALGYTGDPFEVNVTVREYMDAGNELTVKVNWSHGSLSSNDTMNFTGGSNLNGFYYNTSFVLDLYSTADLTYNVYVNDTSGNSTVYGPHTVRVLDNDPPSTTLAVAEPVHPNGGTNNSNVTTSSTIYLNATDNIGSYYVHYRIWNTTSSWSTWTVGDADTDLNFTLVEEGKNYIEYYANDSAGNNETHHNITLWVDYSDPTTSLSINEQVHPSSVDGCNVTSSTTMTLSAVDNPAHGSGVASTSYRFWNSSSGWTSWTAYSGAFSLGSDNGLYYLEFNSTDNLGNPESSNNWTIWVDNTHPTTSLSIDSPNHPSATDGCNVTSSTNMTLSAVDNPAHNASVAFSWYTDNGAYSLYSGAFTLSGGGSHNITYGSQDYLGNNETANNMTLWVDDTPPTTSLSINEQVHPSSVDGCNVTSSTTMTLSAVDNPAHGSGVASTSYRFWNSSSGWTSWTAYSGAFSLGSDNGLYYLEFNSTDNLGNPESSNNWTIWVDNTAPNSSVNTISPYWKNSDPFQVYANASDNLSGVASVYLYYRYSSDNGSWSAFGFGPDPSSPYIWGFTFQNGEGYYQLYTRATDNLGNLEPYSGADAYCGYDNSSPSSSVNSISGSYWKTSATIINATANDSLSGVSSVSLYYRYSSDNFSSDIGGWTSFGSAVYPHSWNFTFTNGSGYYQFYSIAVDNATNNETYSGVDAFCGYDDESPNSNVDVITPYWKNSSQNPLTITVNASDNHSGVASVILYYRYNAVNNSWGGVTWDTFGSAVTTYPYEWAFNFTNGSGYYQFYSVAVDNATNVEIHGPVDALCGYDTNAPVTSVNAITPYWNNTGSITLTASATDALSGIASVSFYYYNSSDNATFSNASYWIATDTTAGPYSCSFNFTNGTGYYRFYSVSVDNVGNTENETTNYTIAGYDTTAPSSSINNQTAGYYSYFQNSSTLTITATVNESSETYGSGISSVCLYYWYHNATDNVTKEANPGDWNGSFLFGTNSTPWINTSAVTWTFTFTNNGTGYYRFCSRVYDNATNAESLLALGQVNGTECLYNNTPPNTPTRVGPTGTSVSTSANLEWNCTDPDTNDTLTYDVYFGTDSTPDSSELVSSNQTAKTYDPSLSSSTPYYWKIVAWDNHNASTSGPIWSFTTQSSGGGGGSPPSGGGGDLTGPTAPSNVRCTSSSNDNTPSFAWDESTDTASDVAGYYVKINDGTETSIGDVLTYGWPVALSDGTYTFYVRARDDSSNQNYGSYGSCSFTINTSSSATNEAPTAYAGGPYTALTFENITFDGSESTDDGIIENYTWDFGDGTFGYSKEAVHSYNESGIFNVTLTVTDDGGLTDTNTTTVKIDLNSDPDDVSDDIEIKIGSNPYKDDVKKVMINEVLYYAVDEDDDGVADKYYGSVLEKYVTIKKQVDGTILIDEDDDGIWDSIYDPASGLTQVYVSPGEEGGIPWYVYIIVIIAIIFIIVFAMFKTGYLYIEEDKTEPKKPAKKTAPKKDAKKKTPNKKKK